MAAQLGRAPLLSACTCEGLMGVAPRCPTLSHVVLAVRVTLLHTDTWRMVGLGGTTQRRGSS